MLYEDYRRFRSNLDRFNVIETTTTETESEFLPADNPYGYREQYYRVRYCTRRVAVKATLSEARRLLDRLEDRVCAALGAKDARDVAVFPAPMLDKIIYEYTSEEPL